MAKCLQTFGPIGNVLISLATHKIINSAQKLLVANCLLWITSSASLVSIEQNIFRPLFDLLPSGMRYRNNKAQTNRFKGSSFPRATNALNASK